MTSFYRFCRWLIRVALGFYYAEIETRGLDRIPRSGPLLLLANHHISLVDPMLLISEANRPVRFIAKAPLFAAFLIGFFLRRLQGIPAYRQQDPGYAKEKNGALYAAVGAVLREGGAIGIFPEGRSHDDPALGEFRHGASKMAFEAEAAAGFRLGVMLQPVGIHFEKSRAFRGRLLVTFGLPVPIADRRGEFDADPRAAIERLTTDMHERLSRLVLDAADEEDVRHAAIVESLLPHDETGIRARFEREKTLLEAYKRLRETHPREVEAIRRRLRAYDRILGMLGETPGSVKRSWGARLGRVLVNLAALAIGAPLLALGVAVNAVPFWVTRLVALIRMKSEERGEDVRAGVGLVVAVTVFPVWYAGLAVAGWLTLPLWAWLPPLAAGPFCGLAAIRWLERWRRLAAESGALILTLFTRPARRRLDSLASDIRARIAALA